MRVRSRESGEKSECRVVRVKVQEMYQQSRLRTLRTSAAILCRRLPPSAELEFLLLGREDAGERGLEPPSFASHLSTLTQ